MKNKIIKSILILVMIVGVFVAVNNISVEEIKAATNAVDAPDDWAFTEASIPLHDAILANYGSIDTGDGKGGSPDGYISKDEAATYSGTIDLASKGISGTMNGIEFFTNITLLKLNNNQLIGNIPSSIGNITNLKNLQLNNNQLTGEIPANLWGLTGLTRLQLGANSLSGTISSDINKLENLQYLQMQGNQLSGVIPESIGDLTGLIQINLSTNKLEGKIPESIGQLFNLTQLDLNTNLLSGEIPASIGGLTSVTQLKLNNNQLSGNLPNSIGNLTSLEVLTLYCNDLEGVFPEELSNLTSLKALNYLFTNVTTANLSSLNQLTELEITKSTNANLNNVTKFYISGSKGSLSNDTSLSAVRVICNAGALSWDSSTSYYVISPNMNASYTIALFTRTDGIVTEIYTNIGNNLSIASTGGLMDQEGNLIIGASLSDIDITTGNVNLPNGGTVVTGDATYTFDKATTVGETEITTEGIITIANNTTDGSSVTVGDTTTIVKVPEGNTATITLDGSGGTTNVPVGSVITSNSGSETYLTGNGSVTDDGVITSSDITVTVPIDKVTDILVDGNEVTFPSGVIVDDGSTSITYPGTIIFDTDDNTLTYLPVDGLFNEDGTLKDEVTQNDITNSQDFVTGLEDSNLKTELQNKVDEAQRQYNEREAQKAVDDLFDDEILNDDVTQDDIKNAQDLVNKLPDGDLKNELNDRLKDAQKQLDERNFVIIEAFKVFTGEGTVYTKIDAPIEKFTKLYVDGKELDASNYEVTSGSTIITLTEAYLKTLKNGTYDVEVEFTSGAVVSTELTVKVTLTHPSLTPPTTTNPTPSTPTVSKPSTDVGSTTNSSSVNTSDATDLTGLYVMLALSILGIVVIRKRKEA